MTFGTGGTSPLLFPETLGDHIVFGPTCTFILINMAFVKELHEVTVCIYKQSDEKPAMKWSFLTKIEEKNLSFGRRAPESQHS